LVNAYILEYHEQLGSCQDPEFIAPTAVLFDFVHEVELQLVVALMGLLLFFSSSDRSIASNSCNQPRPFVQVMNKLSFIHFE
jgi:hypothetical protein